MAYKIPKKHSIVNLTKIYLIKVRNFSTNTGFYLDVYFSIENRKSMDNGFDLFYDSVKNNDPIFLYDKNLNLFHFSEAIERTPITEAALIQLKEFKENKVYGSCVEEWALLRIFETLDLFWD